MPSRSKPKRQHEAWTEVCPVDEFAPGERRVVYLDGKQVALFNLGGKFYAISNRCSHARGPLSEGDVDSDACTVVCPWHYAKYDLTSGSVIDGIASAPVEAYTVAIRDGVLVVGTRLPETTVAQA